MNPFEQYTLIIGLVAVAIEGGSHIKEYLQKVFRHNA
jgi:Flp pilus assembly pilin Flp